MPKDQRRDGPTDVKTFPAKVIGIDEKEGIVEAIVAVIGNIDDGDDIIHSGAFKKTITEHARRIRVLDQHKTDSVLRVVGKPIEIREVGKNELPPELLKDHPDATGGLYTKTQYLMETPEGKGVFHRIDMDAINEYSIGFSILDSDWGKVELDGKKIPVRNIRTVKLWEYSPVIWGMNPATTTVGVKDHQGDAVEEDKEYTADGPQRRLGDVVCANVHGILTRKISDYLMDGYLNADEYLQMNELATTILNTLIDGIPEDIAQRPLESYMLWWFSGDEPDEVKRPTPRDDGVTTAADEIDSQKAGPSNVTPTDEGISEEDDEDAARKNVDKQKLQRVLVEKELLELSLLGNK